MPNRHGSDMPAGEDYDYGFNGHEKDDEVRGTKGASYDFGLRHYDPRLGRMLSQDPRALEYPWQTTYAYHRNSPISTIDFLGGGDKDDNITLNDDGEVVNVEENDDPNRFFDEDGNELFFNDAPLADKDQEYAQYYEGDQVYFPVSGGKFGESIIKAGINPVFKQNPGNSHISLVATAISSWSGADFTHAILANDFPISKEGATGILRVTYRDDAGYFKFENSNVIYNLYDAGNFMWGAWMQANGYSKGEATKAAHINSIFSFDGYDTDADQKAINEGFDYLKK